RKRMVVSGRLVGRGDRFEACSGGVVVGGWGPVFGRVNPRRSGKVGDDAPSSGIVQSRKMYTTTPPPPINEVNTIPRRTQSTGTSRCSASPAHTPATARLVCERSKGDLELIPSV